MNKKIPQSQQPSSPTFFCFVFRFGDQNEIPKQLQQILTSAALLDPQVRQPQTSGKFANKK